MRSLFAALALCATLTLPTDAARYKISDDPPFAAALLIEADLAF